MRTTHSFCRSIKHLLLTSFFATLSTGYAAIPFYEPFADASASGGTSYTVGSVLKGSVNGTGDTWFGTGTTTAGTKAVITAANLSYTGLPTSSGNAFQTSAASGEGGRMFVSSQTSGAVNAITNQNVTLYYSMIVQLTDIAALSTTGDYWIGFNNQGTVNNQTAQPGIQAARLYFRKIDATDFNVGIAKGGTNIAWDPSPRTTSDTLFIVGAYQMNSAGGVGTDDNAYLWVNPDSSTFGQATAPSPTAQLIGTDGDINYISSFVILNRTATCASTAIIDEVRVGKTWKFVTGGPEFVIPPPATTNIAFAATLNLNGTAKSGSGTALSYKWQKNGANLTDGGNISGSTTANLTLSNLSTDDSGTYAVIANDANSAVTNNTFVSVNRPGAIFWRGGNVPNATTWDHSTANWFNPTTSGLDVFHDGDAVVFDDTVVTNLVNAIGTNAPALMTTSNNIKPITLTGSAVVTGPLDVEGTSTVTLALSNAPSFSGITNNSGSLIFALGGTSNVVASPISDNGGGQGTLIQNGSNTLVLNGNNSSYNGQFVVQSGTLKAGTAKAFGGSTAKIIVSNGGTLDLGGFNFSNNAVAVQGTGAGGTDGAVNNSATGSPQQALAMVTFAGDTTFNATGARWDIGSNTVTGGYIHGNGFALTKIGSQPMILKDVGETGLGDIHIVAGRLGFQGNVTVGDPNKTLTAESGTVLTFFSVVDGQNKKLVLNSATFDSGGAANSFYGPITLNGACTMGMRFALDIRNDISGTGSLIATVNDSVGNGAAGTQLRLHGINTYTGATIVRTNAAVILDAQSAPASSLIEVDGTLDATAVSTWTLASGQTVTGIGTLNASSVNFSSGSTFAPGASNATATLTFNGSPTFRPGSTTLFKLIPGGATDQVTGLQSVTFGGTLVLSNFAGTPFQVGNSFTLFSAGGYQGSFGAIIPATPGNGLAWDTSNLAVNGSLAVVAQPHFTGNPSKLPDGNFEMTFSGPVGQQYRLLATTNIALPLASWAIVDSGTVQSDPFTVSDLTATNYSKRFYSLGFGQ